MVYFFLQGSPLQFKVCAIFQLSIDFGERRRVLIQCVVILSSYFLQSLLRSVFTMELHHHQQSWWTTTIWSRRWRWPRNR